MKLWVALLLHFAICWAKDFYQILELDRQALDLEIRLAYRRLSLKYHPDKNPGLEEAHERFIEVGEAYEVLKDETKRSNYDTYGDPDGPGGHGGGANFGDMFNQFFGGGFAGGGFHGQPAQRQGEDTVTDIHLSLAEFYKGKFVEFGIEMQDLCSQCHGLGLADGEFHKCSKCQGRGEIVVQRQIGPGMITTMRMPCDACQGKGNTIKTPCGHCKGHGVERGMRNYDLFVKAGLPRDSHVVLHGEGNQIPEVNPGDLKVFIREDFRLSLGYRRVRDNLYRTEMLTVAEAVNGDWQRQLRFLDDLNITLSRGPGEVVSLGHVEVIKGKGMPKFRGEDDVTEYGDLFVEYVVLMTPLTATTGASDGAKGEGHGNDEL